MNATSIYKSSSLAVEHLEARNLLDAASFVRGLYADILNRPSPSQGEVDGWVSALNAGANKDDVVHAFVESPEHRSLVINDDYVRLLGRSAEPGGMSIWLNQMANGMREDEVERSILGSAEYLEHHGGTDDSFVDAVYVNELHRSAEANGKAFWLARLSSGSSRDQVASEILSSHESHTIRVEQEYEDILHRSSDDVGRQVWVDALDHGMREFQLQEAFAESNEYADDHGGGPHG